jgi:hypothetical protein
MAARMASMTKRTTTAAKTGSVGILRWVFLRGRKALTCEVRMNGERSHDVCVVPHWDVKASIVERFARPGGAMRRHAEIAREFRQAGWTVVHELAN